MGNATTFGYNAADQLITATVSGSSAYYLYDADGRRVKQTVGGSTVTKHLWDELSAYGDVVLETDGNGVISWFT